MTVEDYPARTLDDLQYHIGYRFSNPKILEEAITRRAYLNENPSPEETDMESLATLGDAVLGAAAVYWLFGKKERTKGKLTDGKINLVNRDRTRKFAQDHNLDEYIQWGEGEKKQRNWEQGNKALDTVTEALIGAVFLDAQECGCSGMTVVMKMLERMNYF